MQQEIRSLQRYKTDSESSSSGDRTRIGHLETKLRDLYYELEKANKEKDAAALELGVVKSHYAQQKEQLVKLGQDKKEAEMELNRLQMVALPVSNNRPPSSNK
jgi:chromosome segregation ATPase